MAGSGDAGDRPGVDVVGRVREAELMAAAKELGVREVTLLGYPDGALDSVDPRSRAGSHRGPSAPHQAAGGRHVRSGGSVRPSRPHRHLAADDSGHRASGRSRVCRLEAVSHRVERADVGRVPGGAQEADQHGRRRRTAGGPVAGLGDHDADRHERRVADGLARSAVPSDADEHLREPRGASSGASSGPVGRAGVLLASSAS